jgi:putative ABC transport system permease protein
LTILAVSVGALSISLTLAIGSGVRGFFNSTIGSLGGSNVISAYKTGDVSDGAATADGVAEYVKEKQLSSQFVSPNELTEFEKFKNVDRVIPMKETPTEYIKGENGKKFVAYASLEWPEMKLPLENGNQLNSNSTQNEVIVSRKYAKALGYQNSKEAIGKKVSFGLTNALNVEKEVDGTIVGVKKDSGNLMNFGGDVVVNEHYATTIYEVTQEGVPNENKNRFSGVYVIAKNDKAVSGVIKQMAEKGYWASTLQQELDVVTTSIDAITSGLAIFGAITLLAAAFGMINTLYMSVRERTKEIGLWKALGQTEGKIFALFSMEALVIGLIGSIVGIGFSMIAGAIINNVARNTFLKGQLAFSLTDYQVLHVLLITFGI